MSTQSFLTQALYKKGLALPTMLQLYQEKGDVACLPFVWDGTAVFEEACVLSQIIPLRAYTEYLIGTPSTEDDASSKPPSSVMEHRILVYFLGFFSVSSWMLFSIMSLETLSEEKKKRTCKLSHVQQQQQQQTSNNFHVTVETAH